MPVSLEPPDIEVERFARDGLDGERFARDGFVVLRRFLPPAEVAVIRAAVDSALDPLLGPVEYEADVGYPGAPPDRAAEGGGTPRRLLNALSRDAALRAFATSAALGHCLRTVLDAPAALVSQCHHNCIMTKHPGFSSRTGWHQDIRYWSFDRPELVSAWLALGAETADNGCLLVIPGSHRLELDRGRFDAALFLRDDLPENRELIDRAIPVLLAPGDLLLFHCRLFHAAGANRSRDVKLSVVFTCHAPDNRPIPGTRSANYPSLRMA